MRTSKEQYQAIYESFNQITDKQQLDELKGIDALHLGLDVAGMVPVVGNVADLANAALYHSRGKSGMAALSAAAAIPGLGLAAGAAKLGSKAKRVASAAATSGAGKQVAKAAAKAKPSSVARSSAARQTGKARSAEATASAARASRTQARGVRGQRQTPAMMDKIKDSAKVYKKAKTAAKVAKKSAIRDKAVANIFKPIELGIGGGVKTAAKGAAKAVKFGTTTKLGAAALRANKASVGRATGLAGADDVQLGTPFIGPRGEAAGAVEKLTSGIVDQLRGREVYKGSFR
jgi:hypothetical protein